MSEEIKYEPVFGPQELFNGAANCDGYLVAVQHSVGQKTKVSFYPSLVEAFQYVTDFPPRGVIFHRAAMRRIIKTPVQHSDDIAVDLFAAKMKEKLAKSRDKGRGGWEDCPIEYLIASLKDHISKGDPVDVANFSMMISLRGESIKTPVWTVADQKAGRLPEVGSTFTYKNETLTCHFIDCDGEIWAHDINDRIVTPWLKDCQPIETPEERAKWLRSEWVKHAIYLYMSSPKNDVASMGDVYDAMLSGELKAPEVE